MKTYCLLAAAVFSLGWGASGPAAEPPVPKPAAAAVMPAKIAAHPWTLVELNGAPAPESRRALSLQFEEAKGRFQAFAGVNRVSGTVELKEDTLKFGRTMSTRMAGPPEAMKLETDYVAALTGATHWKINGAQLEFIKDGTVTARFKPAEVSKE